MLLILLIVQLAIGIPAEAMRRRPFKDKAPSCGGALANDPRSKLQAAFAAGLDDDHLIFAYVGINQIALEELLNDGHAKLSDAPEAQIIEDNPSAQKYLASQTLIEGADFSAKGAYRRAAAHAAYRTALKHLELRLRQLSIGSDRQVRDQLARVLTAIFQNKTERPSKDFFLLTYAEVQRAIEGAGLNFHAFAQRLGFRLEALKDPENPERERLLRFFDGLPRRAGYILGVHRKALTLTAHGGAPRVQEISLRNVIGVEPLSMKELSFLKALAESDN